MSENMFISFGKHDSETQNEMNQIDIKVVKAIAHHQFHATNRNSDIAMLKLKKPVKFNKFVTPITLSNFTLNELDHCFISGWRGTRSTLYT
uniref:Peptidase S1 domain-containing protein n=1 Tax=Romanomermis culicivorax TaxID=13658 RepID=A0A915KFD9_ROMCU